MTGIAGLQAGVEGVIGDTMGRAVSIFQMVDMAIYTRYTFLVMVRVRKIHTVLIVTSDT